jgi:hypothetical protein
VNKQREISGDKWLGTFVASEINFHSLLLTKFFAKSLHGYNVA